MVEFKLYDINWRIFYEDGMFSMRCSFFFDDDIRMECMAKAINTMNRDRYIVKVFIEEMVARDEEGNPVKGEPVHRAVKFSFENFCFTESEFGRMYEFAIFAMTDAIDYHRKLYEQYLSEGGKKKSKIGFHVAEETPAAAPATNNKQERRPIGFHV